MSSRSISKPKLSSTCKWTLSVFFIVIILSLFTWVLPLTVQWPYSFKNKQIYGQCISTTYCPSGSTVDKFDCLPGTQSQEHNSIECPGTGPVPNTSCGYHCEYKDNSTQ